MATPMEATIDRVAERQESVHTELIARMDKIETMLTKLDSRPQIIPKTFTAPTFPGVLCAFTDYIGLAMITPALPFFLSSWFEEPHGGLGHIMSNGTFIPPSEETVNHTVSRWTGRITAVQFLGIFVANIFWATYGARMTSLLAMFLTMLGDTACFAGSAFLTHPLELLALRGVTGLCSPLAPAIVYMLDRARNMEQVIEGVSNFFLAIITAYASASFIFGYGYDAFGWEGINIVAAGLNGYALFVVMCYSAPTTKPGPKPVPEGTADAVFTKWFLLHASTAFAQGWMMASMVMMYTLLLKHHFKFTPKQVALVFFFLPVILFMQNRVAKAGVMKFGLNAVSTTGCFMALVNLIVFTVPKVHLYFPTFFLCMAIMQASVFTQQVGNQPRAQKIGAFYAPKAIGAVTAWGRVFFSLGQGIGPYVTGELFAIDPWMGFLGALIVQLTELLAIVVCSNVIPLWRDQDPPKRAAIGDAPEEPVEIECKPTGSSHPSVRNPATSHSSVRNPQSMRSQQSERLVASASQRT